MRPIAGIFVGGRGTRMGGVAKGLLAIDGEPLAARAARIVAEAGADAVLVGVHPAYASLTVPSIVDATGIDGPLAGLVALLEHVGARPALALACDMPFVSAAFVRALIAAPPAAIVAPRRTHWEPLAARYDAAYVLPIARRLARTGSLSLQRVCDEAGAVALTGSFERDLVDWDTPADVERSRDR